MGPDCVSGGGVSFHETLEMEGDVEPSVISGLGGGWGHMLKGSFLGPFLDLPGWRLWGWMSETLASSPGF